MTYWHGGFPRIRVGGKILPPSITGHKCASDYGASDVHSRDRIYITTSFDAAKIWASMYPSNEAVIYEVSPIGEVEPDPDCSAPGLSFQCSGATVVSKIYLAKHVAKAIRSYLLMDALSKGELT